MLLIGWWRFCARRLQREERTERAPKLDLLTGDTWTSTPGARLFFSAVWCELPRCTFTSALDALWAKFANF